MTAPLSVFICIECDKKYDIREIRYRCDCGDLLEVIHDLNASIPRSVDWKVSLDSRKREAAFYRYQDILFPSIPKESIISLYEGDTPLYDISSTFPDFGSIKLKHEGMNPTLSFKDRGMVIAVAKALEQTSKAIICASTGNTSASAAAYGASSGLETIVIIPKGNVASGKVAQAVVYGAKIIAIDGSFDRALEIVREISKNPEIKFSKAPD